MDAFRHLLGRRAGFVPKTQAQALAAVSEGLVDESIFVWKAVNIHPVFEEPWDFNEIERLLAKADLDLETTILLMTIFERLIRDPDKERALFAAESINAIERRFAAKAQALRAEADGEDGGAGAGAGPGGKREQAAESGPEARSSALERLASVLRDFGMACFARPVLKRFYLQEAMAVVEESRRDSPLSCRMASLEIDILLELGERERAEAHVAEALSRWPGDEAFPLLAARSRFGARDWRGVIRTLEGSGAFECVGRLEAIRDFWTGGACRE